jgi:cell division protein FtsI (penicillin-binding protein 3)
MAKMMEGVTDEGGTGTKASVEGYTAAGKTGTAQKVDPMTKCYSASKRTASFVGFVPVEQPKLTILVIVDEPKTSTYGGVVAAPAFSAIAQQTLCYLKVPQNKVQKAKPKPPHPQLPKAQTPSWRKKVISKWEMKVRSCPVPVWYAAGAAGNGENNLNVKLTGAVEPLSRTGGQKISPADQVWVKFLPSA